MTEETKKTEAPKTEGPNRNFPNYKKQTPPVKWVHHYPDALHNNRAARRKTNQTKADRGRRLRFFPFNKPKPGRKGVWMFYTQPATMEPYVRAKK